MKKNGDGSYESFDDFIKKVLEYNPNADRQLLKKAYDKASSLHEAQRRHSGEPFFVHPLGVAKIMIELKADSPTLAAALLHDCVEDCGVTIEDIKKEFGGEVAELVEGVTKTAVVFPTKEEYKAENIRKMLLATTKDIRVMLLKLADRLNNMRTIGSLREDKQKRIAQETLEIYAPIAHKLGIRFIKGELEDLSLKILEPAFYKKIRNMVSEKREDREKRTKEIIHTIETGLAERGIKAEVQGRAKYFYSIYQKMKKHGKDFNEVYDLIAIRIITQTVPECYAALGIVHELWKPMPGRFKDYISVPKSNGYQSLHTSVMISQGKILEIQIRTRDMHYIAEEGIAAHWRYKGAERDSKFDRKISWLKQLLEWKQESKTAEEFVETLKIDLFENEIVVFTPKGDPISLPEHSTPVDFAYTVHTNIGNHCVRAEVNGKLVPLNHILKSGDVINIITQKNAMPARGWLAFIKTSRARGKIKSLLNIKSDYDGIHENVETEATLKKKLEIFGKKAPIKFSKCCRPKYGNPVAAFYTKDGTITIHLKDCVNIHSLGHGKTADVRWKKDEKPAETKKLEITVRDRVGILAEILNVVSNQKINLLSINSKVKKEAVVLRFEIAITKDVDFNMLILTIRSIKDVVDIKYR